MTQADGQTLQLFNPISPQFDVTLVQAYLRELQDSIQDCADRGYLVAVRRVSVHEKQGTLYTPADRVYSQRLGSDIEGFDKDGFLWDCSLTLSSNPNPKALEAMRRAEAAAAEEARRAEEAQKVAAEKAQAAKDEASRRRQEGLQRLQGFKVEANRMIVDSMQQRAKLLSSQAEIAGELAQLAAALESEEARVLREQEGVVKAGIDRIDGEVSRLQLKLKEYERNIDAIHEEEGKAAKAVAAE